MPIKSTLLEELLDGRYNSLSAVERGIVDAWIRGGMSKQAAVDMLYREAKENRYDDA